MQKLNSLELQKLIGENQDYLRKQFHDPDSVYCPRENEKFSAFPSQTQ